MAVRPPPLYLWVAWELRLAGCLDKAAPWEAFVDEIQRLIRGSPVWSPSLWAHGETFEATVGRRLRRLHPADWGRWEDLINAEGVPLKALSRQWGLSMRGSRRPSPACANA